jgi:tRNA1Val (adenine37-N6)-methyltransferase
VKLEITTDGLFSGALLLDQPARGYRVNVDALLLAAFAAVRKAGVCVDLGAGVGGIGLALHHLGAVRRVELVEVQAELAVLAQQNLLRSGASGSVHRADLGHGLPRELKQLADLVVCNPPFFEAHASRPSREPRRSLARFGALAPFVRAAATALRGTRARAAFVYPARSLATLLAEAERSGLVPKRLRLVHPAAGAPARVALIELRKAKPGGLVIEAPLFEWSSPGRYSPELAALLSGRASGRK